MTNKEFARWKKNGNFTISQQRILQITNDIAESIHTTYTKKEAAECVVYWSLNYSDVSGKLFALKSGLTISKYLKQLDDFERKSRKAKFRAK